MIKMAFVAAAAVTMFTAAPSFVSTSAANADNLKVAQGIDVEVGRDREERGRRDRREGVDVTIGKRGGEFGRHRDHCRTVTTRVERGGRTIKKTERRCD